MSDSSEVPIRTEVTQGAISAAAFRLEAAVQLEKPCAPVRDLIGSRDLAAAYAVQTRLVEARVGAGARIVGRKIGATSAAVQQQLGVEQPDFGFLLDDMEVADGGEVPWQRLLQPRVEAELAFVLGEDLADGPLDADQVAGAVEHVHPALEIVDSRIRDWDISFADTVADNASSGLFVLGRHSALLCEVDVVGVSMELTVGGAAASHGTGAACLGSPLIALSWLARQARAHGRPLLEGQVVLSGALGPLARVERGQRVVARFSGLGEVSAQF